MWWLIGIGVVMAVGFVSFAIYGALQGIASVNDDEYGEW